MICASVSGSSVPVVLLCRLHTVSIGKNNDHNIINHKDLNHHCTKSRSFHHPEPQKGYLTRPTKKNRSFLCLSSQMSFPLSHRIHGYVPTFPWFLYIIVNVGKYTIHVLDFHSCTHLAPIANGFDFTPSLFPQFAFRFRNFTRGLGRSFGAVKGVLHREKGNMLIW